MPFCASKHLCCLCNFLCMHIMCKPTSILRTHTVTTGDGRHTEDRGTGFALYICHHAFACHACLPATQIILPTCCILFLHLSCLPATYLPCPCLPHACLHTACALPATLPAINKTSKLLYMPRRFLHTPACLPCTVLFHTIPYLPSLCMPPPSSYLCTLCSAFLPAFPPCPYPACPFTHACHMPPTHTACSYAFPALFI